MESYDSRSSKYELLEQLNRNIKGHPPGDNNSCLPKSKADRIRSAEQCELMSLITQTEFATCTVSAQALLEFNAGSCQLTTRCVLIIVAIVPICI